MAKALLSRTDRYLIFARGNGRTIIFGRPIKERALVAISHYSSWIKKPSIFKLSVWPHRKN